VGFLIVLVSAENQQQPCHPYKNEQNQGSIERQKIKRDFDFSLRFVSRQK